MLQPFSLLITTLLFTTTHFEPEAPKAPKELLGTWVPEKGELGGKKLPEAFLKATELTIEANSYIVKAESPDKGDLKFGEEKNFKTMDILGKEGPNQGKTILCIYEMKDGKLTICYDLEGKQRPGEFATKAGKKQLLMTYQKKKE